MGYRNNTFGLIAGAAALLGAAQMATAQTPLTTTRVASGLVRPMWVTHAPGDFDRVFIVEKQGRIRILRDGAIVPIAFLDIDLLVTGGTTNFDERGLLGVAFHPDFQNNGFFYCNYIDSTGGTTIARFQVVSNPDVVSPGTRSIVMMFSQPFQNHNGGWMEFGPDGNLWIATGDGGDRCDPAENAQDITNNRLGKILRIDVDGDDFPADVNRNYAIPADNPFVGIAGDDEIWAFGLRNPWRNDIDDETGDLWIADVGQDQYEEINFEPASSPGGRNYGWDCREGLHPASDSTCFDTDCSRGVGTMINPIHEYTHQVGCSITGGEVYRGCAIPDLSGTYFFADFCANRIWSFRYNGTMMTNFMERTAQLAPGGGLSITSITSFGADAFGELYICDQNGGEVFKIIPDVPGGVVGDDCNDNGVDDACEIRAEPALDGNGNGVLDSCEVTCLCDFNGDTDLNTADFFEFFAAFFADPPDADINNDGMTDTSDFFEFFACFFDPPPECQ